MITIRSLVFGRRIVRDSDHGKRMWSEWFRGPYERCQTLTAKDVAGTKSSCKRYQTGGLCTTRLWKSHLIVLNEQILKRQIHTVLLLWTKCFADDGPSCIFIRVRACMHMCLCVCAQKGEKRLWRVPNVIVKSWCPSRGREVIVRMYILYVHVYTCVSRRGFSLRSVTLYVRVVGTLCLCTSGGRVHVRLCRSMCVLSIQKIRVTNVYPQLCYIAPSNTHTRIVRATCTRLRQYSPFGICHDYRAIVVRPGT